MKKTLLILLFSSLLVASMAGTALAEPAEMNIAPAPITYGTPSTVTIYHLAAPTDHARMIKLAVSQEGLSVRVHGNGFDSGWVNPPLVDPIIMAPTTVYVPSYDPTAQPNVNFVGVVNGQPHTWTDGRTYTIEVGGNTAGGQVYILDSWTSGVDGKYDSVMASPGTGIPEFPTVALPVAGVLGLLFVFGRKKEGL